jgi:hypothetical protein
MAIHRGTELNNVNETWNQNERNRGNDDASGATGDATTVSNDLEQIIREEAAEYDRANKEERLLGGERATINDDQGGGGDDE